MAGIQTNQGLINKPIIITNNPKITVLVIVIPTICKDV